MYRAEVSLQGEGLDVVARALTVEGERDLPGASVRITLVKEDEFTLTVESQEASALRAALNSYLRWVDLGLRVQREA